MRIMVFDVPAESGGALSVLYDYYNKIKLNQEHEYIFVISLPELKETCNIKVLRFPWIKKSRLHRLFFDHFIAPKLIKKYQIDKVLSLQNVIIPHTNVHQSVLVHNYLPFTQYRFSYNEDKLLWFYQNIVGKKIIKSIKKANHVIVQTNWMKKKLMDYLHMTSEKIEIIPPKIDIKVKNTFKENNKSFFTFFYPANGSLFKNHKVIVDACLILKKNGITNYNIVFTLKGNENNYIANLYNIIEKNELPIRFIGSLAREEVFDFYSKSVLLFPSYIETVGLPLIEAKMHDAPIIVSDCDYSREILKGYNKVQFFNFADEVELYEKIYNTLNLK